MDQLIRFRCECGKKLKATRDIVGKKVRCTKCPRTHRVPESDRLPPKEIKTPVKSVSAAEATSQGIATTSTLKKKDAVKPATPQKSISVAGNQAQSNDILEKPSLIIRDELSAKEPSLLPSGDDSDPRFKLDPKFDPAPSDAPLDPSSSFEFDFDAGVDNEQAAEQDIQLPSDRQANGKSKIVVIVAAAVGVLLLSAIGWVAFG